MSRTTAGLPKTENSPSSGPQGQEGGFFYEREEVRQALSHMGLSADDDPLAPAGQRNGGIRARDVFTVKTSRARMLVITPQ